MIKYNDEIILCAPNGENNHILLNERQINNLLIIIEEYKESYCGDSHDIRACEELIEILEQVNQ